MKKYHAKRLYSGHYLYIGFKVNCLGYYEPERRIVWEAIDENGCGFAHSFTLRDTKRLIDDLIDKQLAIIRLCTIKQDETMTTNDINSAQILIKSNKEMSLSVSQKKKF